MDRTRKIIIAISILIFIGMGVAGGFFWGKTYEENVAAQSGNINFTLFWDAWKVLQDKYVDPSQLDIKKMLYGAVKGMVASLGDPYTVFMNPEDSKKFQDDVKGSFDGIGAEIGIKDSQLVVIAPLEGTPAQKAGLRSGDMILKIDNKSTVDFTTDDAINLIRGSKGTEVTLNIFRTGWLEAKDIKIMRDTILVPTVKWQMKENDIAYIQVYQFSETASADFAKAANEILKSGAKKIIFDVRDNPGGYLEVSQDIASWFLPAGKVVAIEDFGDGKEKKEYKSSGIAKFVDYPMVVLINEGSASASEIFAGAMRDDRQVKLIGKKSFGKGSVQELQDLAGGSTIKVTIARWLTPNGTTIHEKGLEPDVKVDYTEDDLKAKKDPQLDKAIEIIKGL